MLELSLIYSILYPLWIWLLVSSLLLEQKLACVPSHGDNFPHTLCRRCGPYVVASLSRTLLYLLNRSSVASIEVANAWGSARLSSFSMHGKARAVSFPVSNERQQSPWSIGQYLCKFLCRGALLAVGHFLLHILQSMCSFSWKLFSELPAMYCLVWLFAGLPFTHLYPWGSPGRGIWNLVVPDHSSERVTPFASVHKSLIICSETLFMLV